MSSEFMRKYAKSCRCRGCDRWFSVKGIKQHERACPARQAMYQPHPKGARRMAGKRRLRTAVILKAWEASVHPGVRADMTYEELTGSYRTFAGAFAQGWKAALKATKPAAKKGKTRRGK